MKKKLLIVFIAVCAALACAFGLAACSVKDTPNDETDNKEHTHVYDRRIAKSLYIKSAATCTNRAVYYFSCECGEQGTETFESGNVLPHSYTQEKAETKYLKTEATCTSMAVYYKSCSVCGEIGTETFESGIVLPHTFTQEKTDTKYLKSVATCTAKAVYFKSCIDCGEKGTETFEIGNVLRHTYVEGKCKVCQAVQPVTEGLVYELNSDGTAYSCTGIGTTTDKEVKIASTYGEDNLPVTIIGSNAFSNCSNLTSVTIPDGVTTIGDYAFVYCRSLTSITIPNGVTSIGSNAFRGCNNLTSVNIGNGVTTIGERAFYNCNNLTSVIIPDSVTSIEIEAFRGCGKLTSVTISDSVTYIGSSAFENCPIEEATIPISAISPIKNTNLKKVVITSGETIGNYAFNGCRGLTSITIPDSVTSIGERAFEYCPIEEATIPTSAISSIKNTNLKEVVITSGETIGNSAFYGCSGLTSITIPDSVTTIGEHAFEGCFDLTSATIGNGVTTIGWYAFRGCSGLTSVTIPDSVTFIGGKAFSGCSGLTSITIPDSVTTIGEHAFSGCSSLTIYCEAMEKPSDWDSYWDDSSPVIWNCKNNDKDKNGYEYAIIDGIRYSLKDGKATVVGQPSNLTVANIPVSVIYKNTTYSVTTIGWHAFENCSSLTSITIPDSVTTIGKYVFSYCSGLTSITVDENNTKYHSAGNCIIETASKTLIAGCKNSIIPTDGSVTSIGDYAFWGCSGLTSITIPDSVTTIGWSAFKDCSGLTSITIPDGVTSIEAGAFEACNKLIQTENGVQYVGKWVIDCDTSVTTVTLRNDTVGIGGSAFKDCSGLTSITIPDSVTTIGWSAFLNCRGLTSITIPDSVTTIGEQAFEYCSGLTSIYYIGDIASWLGISGLDNLMSANGTLYINGEKLTGELIIPDSVTTISDYAFLGCSGLTSITFKGTKAQWKAIDKISYWNDNTGKFTITCSDGKLDKYGNEVK